MQEDLKYNNPIPVAVAIVPIKREKTYKINNQEVILEVVDVLYVRRNIEPKKGMLAFKRLWKRVADWQNTIILLIFCYDSYHRNQVKIKYNTRINHWFLCCPLVYLLP